MNSVIGTIASTKQARKDGRVQTAKVELRSWQLP